MGTLAVDLLGKALKNPVMNASGTLGYGIEIEPLWNIETLGAYVTKGLSEKPHHGNKTPRVWEERHGMINSIGLQNVGVDDFFSHYFPFFVERKVPVIVNFFGFSEDEYISCARKVPSHHLVVALEMNLSCPNIKKGGISFGKDAPAVHNIVRAVREVTPVPIIAKLTPEVKNIVEIARADDEGLLAGRLVRHQPLDQTRELSGQPDEQQGIGDIEERVRVGELTRHLGREPRLAGEIGARR